MEVKREIEDGKAIVGIELGSTRIKAVMIDSHNTPIAQGGYDWENQLVDGIWTYDLSEVRKGLQLCYADLASNVRNMYGIPLRNIKAFGISAMMHGYIVFDAAGNQLVPFRTWRNTITEQASRQLTKLFDFPIPQRWSVAHLYQAILNEEPHV
ncbi:MAG: FGGY family carbohydrate kinase, partial [Sphaerochaetaceae bacterium]